MDIVSNVPRIIISDEGKIHQTMTYDMIFMDCQMPELDGFAATRKII